MNAAQLENVVAAAFMAFEPEKPCELCVFSGGKCGELSTFDGFCNTGVLLWYKQRTTPKAKEAQPERKEEAAADIEEAPAAAEEKPARVARAVSGRKPAAPRSGGDKAAQLIRLCINADRPRFFETVQSLRDLRRRGVTKRYDEMREARNRITEQWPDIFGPGVASRGTLSATQAVRLGIFKAYVVDVAPELAGIWDDPRAVDYSGFMDASLAAKLRAEAPKAGRVK